MMSQIVTPCAWLTRGHRVHHPVWEVGRAAVDQTGRRKEELLKESDVWGRGGAVERKGRLSLGNGHVEGGKQKRMGGEKKRGACLS